MYSVRGPKRVWAAGEVCIAEDVQTQLRRIVTHKAYHAIAQCAFNVAHQFVQSSVALSIPSCDAFGQEAYGLQQVEPR